MSQDHYLQQKEALSNADHEALAQRQARVLVEHLTDPVTIDKITEAWGGALDRLVGRFMRLIAIRLAVATVLVVAMKSPWLITAIKSVLE